MKKERVILTGEQGRFSDDFRTTKVNLSKTEDLPSKIRIISAGPGSGKTTAIEETLLNFVENNPEEVDFMLENEQKILIIVFGKVNKKELDNRLKKAELPMDLFEISTVNSLFFRHAKELSSEKTLSASVIGGFEINYTESTFTKEKIKTILSTFVRQQTFEDVSSSLENEIKQSRVFSKDILEEEFVSRAWSFVNAFFSSSYGISDKKDLEREAKFFGKKDLTFQDFNFNDNDTEILERAKGIKNNNQDLGEIFIEGLIKRINFIANYKETVVKERKRNFNKNITVEIEGVNGEQISSGNLDMGDTEFVKTFKNVFTVPHSFYYKTVLIEFMQNKELTKKIFSKYVRIIGDEFQDNTLSLLNFIVYLLENKIIGDVSMIGDSKQRIYGFSSSDNFDLLKYCMAEKKLLGKKGIAVEEYTFNQTHRFGKQIASFTNSNFQDSDILGKEGVEDFVYPETLPRKDFIDAIIASAKKGSTMVVCRTNDAAAEMFVRIKEAGELNVRLETSSKKEITDFVRKGPEALPDKEHKKILQDMLDNFDRYNPGFICEKGDAFPMYEKIMSSSKIKSFMRNNGYHQLIRYELEEVEKYLLPAQKRKNSNQITIGTPYPLKGEEADAVFIDGSFFKKELESMLGSDGTAEDATIEEYQEFDSAQEMADALESMKIESGLIQPKEKETTVNRVDKPKKEAVVAVNLSEGTNGILRGIYEKDGQDQEKAVLFVAVTRAKIGIFFEDGVFGRAILDNYPLNRELNKQRGDLFLSPEETQIPSIIEETNLFSSEKDLFNKEVISG